MQSIFRVWSDSFNEGQPIPEGFAFEKIDPTGKNHTVPAGNRNPQISWSNPPTETQSLILICHDPDVPDIDFEANGEKPIPADCPRKTFYHWGLVDITPEESCIDAGALSKGITARGKKGPACANGMRQALNDYTTAMAMDENMSGKYYGYDGPCPPWFDERIHNYCFTIYAVDFPLLALEGPFTVPDILKAMEGHILASSSITGTYTLNRRLVVDKEE